MQCCLQRAGPHRLLLQHVSERCQLQSSVGVRHTLLQPVLCKLLLSPTGKPPTSTQMLGNKMRMPDWSSWAADSPEMRQLSQGVGKNEESAQGIGKVRSNIYGEISLRQSAKPCAIKLIRPKEDTLSANRPVMPGPPKDTTHPLMAAGECDHHRTHWKDCSKWLRRRRPDRAWRRQSAWQTRWPDLCRKP